MDNIFDLHEFYENKVLINYLGSNNCKIYYYSDLISEISTVTILIKAEIRVKNQAQTIGIGFSQKNPTSIALVLGILNASHSFCFEDSIDVIEGLSKFKLQYFFHEYEIENAASKNLVWSGKANIFGKNVHLYKVTTAIPKYHGCYEFCYSIKTSGSTGKEKLVRVPWQSILPNISSLQNTFKLEKDVIYSSAPVTFDVFVVDLFLTVRTGSAMLMLDPNLRFSKDSMEILFTDHETHKGTTFLQTTPSLFHQWGLDNIKSKILNKSSSLKFLVLGGEAFPKSKEIEQWQDWNDPDRKRVFNIYGITEVSCWATIKEVTKSDLEAEEISIGAVLDEKTMLAYVPCDTNATHEALLVGSKTRICIIDDEKSSLLNSNVPVLRATGDIMKKINNEIFYVGRTNEIVKKLGTKVNMSLIESSARDKVSEASCIFLEDQKIVLFFKSEDETNEESVMDYLRSNLKPNEVPDVVRKIKFFPLTSHGKICKDKLMEYYKEAVEDDVIANSDSEQLFLNEINQIFKLELVKLKTEDQEHSKKVRTEMGCSFKFLGGTSFDALRIAMKLERNSSGLLSKLLNEETTIKDICIYLRDHLSLTKIKEVIQEVFRLECKVIKKFDLGKCIDASLSLFEMNDTSIVSVGSHSHYLINIDATTLQGLSKLELGDRIESQAALLDKYGVVGCYDGLLYCFDIASGDILAKFNSGGMIKSKILVMGELVIFGNYNPAQNLYCIQKEGDQFLLKWSKFICVKGIVAGPLKISDDSVLACSLDGVCEMININVGVTIWRKKFENPIFANPQLVPGRKEVLIAEVANAIHCLDLEGNIIWTYKTDGNIFSSFEFLPIASGLQIFFGCHDRKLRCLNYIFEDKAAVLCWEKELQSQIYSTPKIISINSENFIVSCTTNGNINLLSITNGNIESSMKLLGEIFSSPVVFKNQLFVGSRDNCLYCLKFED
ncbi:unnamed protein product [Diamesa serratosioi]